MTAIKAWSEAFNALSLDIDQEKHGEYWLKGGRGSGKSTFIARKIVLGMLAHPRANAIIYRRVADTLRSSVYEEITKAIDALGLRPWCVFRLAPLEVRFKPTGQRILFRGADDPGKSKSITLSQGYFGYLWFEEAAEFACMADLDTITASIVRGAAEQRPIVFLSYNPPISAQEWINEAVIKPRAHRLVHSSTYLDLPPEWIGPDFIAKAEEMKATNERAYRHMYLGEAVGTGGQVFDNLHLRAIAQEELGALHRRYFGLDLGFTIDPAALVACAYSPAKRALLVYDERYGPRLSNATLARYVREVAGREIVRCDNEDPRTISELRGLGATNVIGVKKGRDSVRHGLTWLQNLGQIVIDPERCPNAAREFSLYEYGQDRYGNFINEFQDVNNHTIDAVRYAMTPESERKTAKTMPRSAVGL